MRLTQLFGKTQREVPADADTDSHRLLLRAGMMRQAAAGVYSYLPLAWRVLQKIENIIRDEMDKAGGQELRMPSLQPFELWEGTGRDIALGQILFTLSDRRDRKLALGPTHEEIITELVKHNVQSYRDLPLMLYQIQTKFRDELRPRSGLIRAREFIMKDLYSFDTDEKGLDHSYEVMRRAYQNIFDRCGIPTILVEADSGAIGGRESREFMLLTDSGEDEIIHCTCGYAANKEKAVSLKGEVGGGEPLTLEEVATPGVATIEEVAAFLKVSGNRTLKAVFYIADKQLIFIVIRGDLEVNEVKLKNTLKSAELRMANEEEVAEAGLVPGAASPVGISGPLIIADDSVKSGTNFIAGGNKSETHLRNVNYPRDFKVDIIEDIAEARNGDPCSECGKPLSSSHSIELGHIFKLGTAYTEKLDAHYFDHNGQPHPVVMGCYGIGPTRLLAAIIEHNHDDKGIIWPLTIAPYQVHICPLYRDNTLISEVADKLYIDLTEAGLEVLLDDRDESPGVKFNDADLLGIPVRITISPRTIENKNIELKQRTEKDSILISIEDAIDNIKDFIGS